MAELNLSNYENQALQSIGSAVDALHQASQQEKSFNRYATLQTQQQEKSQDFRREEDQNKRMATAAEGRLMALGQIMKDETDPAKKEHFSKLYMKEWENYGKTGAMPSFEGENLQNSQNLVELPKDVVDVVGQSFAGPQAPARAKQALDMLSTIGTFRENTAKASREKSDRKRQDDTAQANSLLSAMTLLMPTRDTKTGAIVDAGDPEGLKAAKEKVFNLYGIKVPQSTITTYQKYAKTPEFDAAYTMMQMKHPELNPLQIIQAVTDAIDKAEIGK